MVDHRLHVHPRLGRLAPRASVAGVLVRERDDPAEVAPAALVAHEQGEMTGLRPSAKRTSISAPWIALIPQSGALCASSIEPETELWSVNASAT